MTRVVASRYAVVTHAMCDTPPRSPTMVGIAVETIVWSRAAMSMPASRAEKMRLIRRRVSTMGAGATGSLGRLPVGGLWVGGAGTRAPRSGGGAAGARHRRSGRRRPLGWDADRWCSAGRGGQPGRDQVPRIIDEAGQ